MSIVEIERLLENVARDACGDNLEYDADFIAMEQAAVGRPEQVLGATTRPEQPPDWREVARRGADLLGRTRDLRIAVLLCRALLHLEGFRGYADGLRLLRHLIEHVWADVHPQLDPADDNDPTMRVNVLRAACDETVVRALRDAALVEVQGLGRVRLRDVLIASGRLAVPAPAAGAAEPMSPATIAAAFAASALDGMRALEATLSQTLAELRALEPALAAHVGGPSGIEWQQAEQVLQQCREVVVQELARRGVGSGGPSGDGSPSGNGSNGSGGGSGSVASGGEVASGGPGGDGAVMRPPGTASSGDIASREDVIRVLERVCEYFERYEPSSPVPLLIQRAKRLVSKSFIEVVRDLTPDGVAQAILIAGVKDGEQ